MVGPNAFDLFTIISITLLGQTKVRMFFYRKFKSEVKSELYLDVVNNIVNNDHHRKD